MCSEAILVVDFTPDASGLHLDSGLVNGTTYHYQVQGLGLSGVTSAPSIVFSGTPAAGPFQPIGGVSIGNGAEVTDLGGAVLHLYAPDATEMRIADDLDAIPASIWLPLSSSQDWAFTPGIGPRSSTPSSATPTVTSRASTTTASSWWRPASSAPLMDRCCSRGRRLTREPSWR
jgi:hypothetical protein